MADVFISYSREDRARAEQIAHGLQGQGFDVFWDSEIPPGQTWADYIEEKLSGCKAVIVLWSQHSAKSQWVREEARMGRDRGKLIPVMIDATPAPFGFGEVQAADLTHWAGASDDPNWRRVVEAVRGAAQRAAAVGGGGETRREFKPQPAMAPARAGRSGPPWLWIGGGVAIVLALIVAAVSVQAPSPQPMPQPMIDQAQIAPPVEQQAPAAQLTQQQYQEQILMRLGAVQQAMGSQGFQQIGEPTSGALNAGASQTIPAQLYVGYEYRFAGVCDQDCGDLDLTLYDGMNNVISQDTSADNNPIVPVLVTGSGGFTLQVHMYACSVQPCYFAAALFGRPVG